MRRCVCCQQEFDEYYVRHYFTKNHCEPCFNIIIMEVDEDDIEEDETP